MSRPPVAPVAVKVGATVAMVRWHHKATGWEPEVITAAYISRNTTTWTVEHDGHYITLLRDQWELTTP